jgi:hypothetical protein
MNTIPLTLLVIFLMGLLLLLAPRHGEGKATIMSMVIRGLYGWARFWWSLVVGIEAGYHRFRGVQAELREQREREEQAERSEAQ